MRYLTKDEKKEILNEWDLAKKGPIPDKDIIPLCDSLNRLDGVCTVQSCAGHPDTPAADGSGMYIQKANLWIRLDEKISRRFYDNAFSLVCNELIEVVETCYKGHGSEIANITFEGNNSGKLSESSEVILSFFQNLGDKRRRIDG